MLIDYPLVRVPVGRFRLRVIPIGHLLGRVFFSSILRVVLIFLLISFRFLLRTSFMRPKGHIVLAGQTVNTIFSSFYFAHLAFLSCYMGLPVYIVFDSGLLY